MDKPSTSTAEDPGQAVESTEPSRKKSKVSEEAIEPPKPLLTLEEEFKALRDEYDEHRLDTMVEENKLTKAQRSLLCKPVHKHMVRSEVFLGNKHRDLADLVSDVGFGQDEQDRRIVGIVQPFGAGKTKTALMLSHAFAVLPIRWKSSHPMRMKLVEEQLKLFSAIDQERVTETQVRAFSAHCLRLVELSLLSVAAIFSECAKTSWFDAQSWRDRLQFAILAISDGSAVVAETVKWFDDNVKKTSNMLQFNQLRTQLLGEVQEKSGRRIVFVIDEIQELRKLCLGYCLHENENAVDTDDPSEFINSWKGKHAKNPAGEHLHCTDLFYQVCCVITQLLGSHAIVVCSTLFKTFTRIQELCKSMNRRPLERFVNVYSFDFTDCAALIQHYFKVEASHLNQLDLTEFARPMFACDLIRRLNDNLRERDDASVGDIGDWLSSSSSYSLQVCEEDLTDRFAKFLKKSLKVKTGEKTETTTTELLNKLVMAMRLSAGILREVKPDSTDRNWRPYASLIDAGFVKLRSLPSVPACAEIADPLATRILRKLFTSSEKEMVMEMYANHIDENDLFTSQDTSHKGFVFEKLLAYLALRGLITVPKYVADGTVTSERLQSTAQFAAKFDELKAARYSSTTPILANEAVYVGALFGNQLLPSKLNCVLLPCTQNGPDVIFRGNKIMNEKPYEAVNVAIQSKVLRQGSRPSSKTGVPKTGAFGLKEFMAALKTIDPVHMFHAVDSYQRLWQERREQALQRAPYVRIVFAFRGFSIKVQHYVHEYNLQQAQSAAPSFIYLLNADDLKESIGPVHGALKNQTTVEPNLVVSNEMPCYESAWEQLPEGAKKAMPKDSHVTPKPQTLLNLCRLWGIKHSKETKEDLVKALNEHKQTLADSIKQLSLGPSVAAPTSSFLC